MKFRGKYEIRMYLLIVDEQQSGMNRAFRIRLCMYIYVVRSETRGNLVWSGIFVILTLEILNFCSFHKKIGSIRRFTIIKGNIDSERFYIFLEKIFRSSHHALKKLLNCTNIVEDSPSRILNFSSFHKRIGSIPWSTIIKENKMKISSDFIFFVVEKNFSFICLTH